MTAPERPAGRPARGARPAGARPDDDAPTPGEQLIDQLVPLAAELAGCVRDYGPNDIAAVLAKVPDGRHDALAIVLAAMVDPDATASALLAWVDVPPSPRESRFGPLIRDLPAELDEVAIERAMAGDPIPLRPVERTEAVRRLSAAGQSVAQIAVRLGLTKRSVVRHRARATRRTA